MSFTCEKCSYTTDRKLNYDRHCISDKHRLKVSPLSQQLHELKIKEMELKTESKMKEYETKAEIKRAELEKKQELKIKEMELKQQIKETLTKSEEKIISYYTIERSISMIKLMERVIDRSTIEDYFDIFNGVSTFEDIFMRDFLAEYEENKSIVIMKGSRRGYYINNAPCIWGFGMDEVHCNTFRLFLTLVTLYHKYLKDYAKENSCKVENFILSPEVQKSLEDRLIEEITYTVKID